MSRRLISGPFAVATAALLVLLAAGATGVPVRHLAQRRQEPQSVVAVFTETEAQARKRNPVDDSTYFKAPVPEITPPLTAHEEMVHYRDGHRCADGYRCPVTMKDPVCCKGGSTCCEVGCINETNPPSCKPLPPGFNAPDLALNAAILADNPKGLSLKGPQFVDEQRAKTYQNEQLVKKQQQEQLNELMRKHAAQAQHEIDVIDSQVPAKK